MPCTLSESSGAGTFYLERAVAPKPGKRGKSRKTPAPKVPARAKTPVFSPEPLGIAAFLAWVSTQQGALASGDFGQVQDAIRAHGEAWVSEVTGKIAARIPRTPVGVKSARRDDYYDEDEEDDEDEEPDSVLVPDYVFYFEPAVVRELLATHYYGKKEQKVQQRVLSWDEAENAVMELLPEVNSALDECFKAEVPAPDGALTNAMSGALSWIRTVLQAMHPEDERIRDRAEKREQTVADAIIEEHRDAVTEWEKGLVSAAEQELSRARFLLDLGYSHSLADVKLALEDFLWLVQEPAAVWKNKDERPGAYHWFTQSEVAGMQARVQQRFLSRFRHLAGLLAEHGEEDLREHEVIPPDTRTLPLFPGRKP